MSTTKQAGSISARRESRINELARIVVTADEESAAAKAAAENELAILLLKLDPGEYARNTYLDQCADVYMEAVAEFLMLLKTRRAYNPEDPLLPYFYKICRGGWGLKKKSDPKSGLVYREGLMAKIWMKEYRDIHKKKEENKDPNTPEMVSRRIAPVSLYSSSQDGDDDKALIDFISASDSCNPEEVYRWKELTCDILIPALVTWLKIQDAKSNGKDPLPRMAFTDYMSSIIKRCWGYETFFAREKEIMNAIHRAFLDYFMSQPCNSLRDIHDFSLKTFPELKCKLPLDARVYVNFLNDICKECVSESKVSRRRTDFKNKFKECLIC